MSAFPCWCFPLLASLFEGSLYLAFLILNHSLLGTQILVVGFSLVQQAIIVILAWYEYKFFLCHVIMNQNNAEIAEYLSINIFCCDDDMK